MDNQDVQNTDISASETVKFVCPNCGEIPQDDVVFLCNTCEQSDLIFKDGFYMCPSCLVPGENFECMICESKDVKMEHIVSRSRQKTSSK